MYIDEEGYLNITEVRWGWEYEDTKKYKVNKQWLFEEVTNNQ